MLRQLLFAASLVALLSGGAALAQVNNNANTPLGSRIRHDRAFPNEPIATFNRQLLTEADQQRSRSMTDQLARCLWDRGNDKGLDLLARTDLGFYRFEQIGIPSNEIGDRYPISHCLGRVAQRNDSGVTLRFSAAGIRQSYLQAAYFDIYPQSPTWLQPGLVVAERSLPLSSADLGVQAQLDFADCVVLTDPQGADYFFRTPADTDIERQSLRALVPAFSACVPEGVQLEINPQAMRIAIGEGLWHAARHSAPASETAAAPATAQAPEESH